MKIDLKKSMEAVKNVSKAREKKFELTLIILNFSKYQLRALSAQYFSERTNSAENLIVVKKKFH